MKVILLDNVDKVGKKFDVKEVAEGYARNFLFPKKLAQPATEQAMKWLETQKEIMKGKAEAELSEMQELATQLDDLEVPIPVKVGDEGQLFESITVQKIAERLGEMGFKVKKDQVRLEEPFHDVGEFPVTVVLDHNLEAQIRVIITEE